jgi:hypothetical protein
VTHEFLMFTSHFRVWESRIISFKFSLQVAFHCLQAWLVYYICVKIQAELGNTGNDAEMMNS